ncbi:helix-turn-helix domain-containing protein [Nonomuraea fuscirosea]|uniref:helix-turn-helix domain-containing protein n=1 Tax=Nonomuraea fuscirosea TaxID=1291556 RepID=UPI002DDA00F5|nr:helix-turn-helix transcriptional regulator [Nonomuraea fuscirosea]WSA57120.1 helix-turn-helix domain-containing protein [Nonomuraea fuscirosea]
MFRSRILSELRKRRDAVGLTGPQAAKTLGWSTSRFSRLETGQLILNPKDVESLLDLYEMPEPTRTLLLDLVPKASAPEWWEPYAEAIPIPYREYLGFESGSEERWEWQSLVISGLLQTEDYSQALIDVPHIAQLTPRQVRRRVEIRMARQQRFINDPSTKHNVVMDESVLARRIGDDAIMKAQLRHIAELAERPNLHIQILLNRQGLPGGYMSNFILLRFPELEGLGELHPDVLYQEDDAGGQLDADEMRAHRHFMVFRFLSEAALSPQDTIHFIEERRRTWK